MESGSTASCKACRLLLVSLICINVFRAATQSITSSEATTFNRWVHPRLGWIWKAWDANNHVLYTLAAKLALTFCRVSEFGLRLPALIAGGLYLWIVYRLARRILGTGPLFLAAFAAVALNPLVLDYLSAARGYGMALAALMGSAELFLMFLDGGSEGLLNWAGLCLGFSVAASIPFAIPALAMGVAAAAVAFSRKRAYGLLVLERLGVTAIVVAFIVLSIPLSHANIAVFQGGASRFSETLHSLAVLSLYHNRLLISLVPSEVVMRWADRLGVALAMAVALASVFLAACDLARRDRTRRANASALVAGAFSASLAALACIHAVAGVAYAVGRYALYLIPLGTVAGLSCVSRFAWRPLRAAALLAAVALAAHYASEFQVRSYAEWSGESGGKAAVQALVREAGNRAIRISASPELEPIVSFYRERFRLRKWEPVKAESAADGFDYYVLPASSAASPPVAEWRAIYNDGAILVARR